MSNIIHPHNKNMIKYELDNYVFNKIEKIVAKNIRSGIRIKIAIKCRFRRYSKYITSRLISILEIRYPYYIFSIYTDHICCISRSYLCID